MKKKLLLLIFIAMIFLDGAIVAQRKRPAPKPKTLTAREIANKVLPSVVLIITQDENGQPISQGSGFVYKPGLVVSNLHVFERASNAIVKNVDTGEISKAIEVVGMNAKEDICVFRIAGTKFPVLALGDSTLVRTGDEIYVASNPKGLEGSFTKGIISSRRMKDRSDDDDEFARLLSEVRNEFTVFQIDAAISPGSSGGVLLNQQGQAIGIIRSTVTGGQNLNFAIPINQLKTLMLKFNHSIQLAGACAHNDRKKEKLKGLVKKIVQKELPREAGTGRDVGIEYITTSETAYDIDGNEIEDVVFQPTDGKLIYKNTYTYDENRLRTSILYNEIITGKIEETPLTPNLSIKYKLDTRKFSQTWISAAAGTRVFDSAGNIVSRSYTEGVRITYVYDADGNEIENTQWRGGKIENQRRFSYKFYSRGNWIEQNAYTNYQNADGEIATVRKAPKYRVITYYE